MSQAEQVHDILVAEIQGGRWELDARVPTIEALAQQSGLSRWPIERAYKMLRDEGRLRSNGKRGTFLHSLLPQGGQPSGWIGVLLSVDPPRVAWHVQLRLHEVMAAISERGYAAEVVYRNSSLNLEEVDRIGRVFSPRVMGVVSFCSLPDRAMRLEIPVDRLPMVFQHADGDACLPRIDEDRRQAAYLLTRKLIERGHSRIALCCMPHLANSWELADRAEGHVRAMEEAGLAVNTRAIEDSGDQAVDADAMAAQFLASHADATAIVSVTGFMARKLIAAAEAHGIRIPADLSVASLRPGPATENPSGSQLASTDPKLGQQMHYCLNALEEAIRSRRYPVAQMLVTPGFIEGHTVGPPRLQAADPTVTPDARGKARSVSGSSISDYASSKGVGVGEER
ncbi:MAG: GntR family transcriptional regulator [Candidatus Sumerlaeota bacterium]|nr:GntR family transcriptional regulator [Candidatus Sumerlaeota bacterium]